MKIMKIMDLTEFKKKDHILEQQSARDSSDGVQGDSILKAPNADCVEHDAENDHLNIDDDDDNNEGDDGLPPLADLLREIRCQGGAGRGLLSPLDGSGLEGGLTQADTGANTGPLRAGDSREEPIELDDDDGPHVAAALAGGIHGNANLKSISQGSIDRSEQPRPAAHRGPVRPSPYGEAATRASIYKDSDRVPPASADNVYDVFAEFDRISHRDRTGPGSQGRQQRPSSLRANPPSSGCSIAEVAAEAARSRDTMDSSAQSCSEPTSKDLCLKHNNCEGPDDEIVLGQELSAAS